MSQASFGFQAFRTERRDSFFPVQLRCSYRREYVARLCSKVSAERDGLVRRKGTSSVQTVRLSTGHPILYLSTGWPWHIGLWTEGNGLLFSQSAGASCTLHATVKKFLQGCTEPLVAAQQLPHRSSAAKSSDAHRTSNPRGFAAAGPCSCPESCTSTTTV